MRDSGCLALLVLVGGIANAAAADEAEVPDPTAVARIPVRSPPPEPSDPCQRDPRCRIARLRAQLAHQRRAEYLERVEAAARAMDERMTRAMPWRLRYPVDANFHYATNLGYGALVGYGPTWWMRLEAFAGYNDHTTYGYDADTNTSTDWRLQGGLFGTQVRVTPVKFALSPFATLGWAYQGGTIKDYSYGFGGITQGDAAAHLVTCGVGLDLVVPYFHIALGYQVGYAFYTQASVSSMHDPNLQKAVQGVMDDSHHGFSLDVGVAF